MQRHHGEAMTPSSLTDEEMYFLETLKQRSSMLKDLHAQGPQLREGGEARCQIKNKRMN